MSQSGFPDLKDGKYFLPSDLIDPAKKATKEYSLAMCQGVYWRYRNSSFPGLNRRSDWIKNRGYAIGNQDNTIYKKAFSKLRDRKQQLVSYVNTSWSIVSIVAKYRDVVLSLWERQDYDIMCDAINPEAVVHRDKAKFQLLSRMRLNPFFKSQAPKLGFDPTKNQGYVPQDETELDMFMDYGFRLPYEIAMEMGIQSVMYENNWPQIAKQIRQDAFDLGVMAACVETDPISMNVKLRYVDPVNMILQDFRGQDGSAMTRIGEIRKITIGELKLMAGNQFTEEEYYKMANSYRGWWSNSSQLNPFSEYINTDQVDNRIVFRDYDDFWVYILDLEWDSVDTKKQEVVFKDGQELRFDRPYSEKIKVQTNEDGEVIKKVEAVGIKTIYGAKWVLGTDYIYDYGKQKNISRPRENKRITFKRYKFYRIANKSILERMIPHADAIQNCYIRMQNIIANAIPKGVAIEIGAFENVWIGKNKMSAKELMELARQTGWIIYRKKAPGSDLVPDSSYPFQETNGGLGNEFVEILNTIKNEVWMIQEVTGINEFMAGGQQADRQAVGTANIAQIGAQNAIYPLISGFVMMQEQVFADTMARLQFLAAHTDFKLMMRSIGGIAQYIQMAGNDLLYGSDGEDLLFTTRVQARATDQQKESILAAAQSALASSQNPGNGGIEVPQFLEIVRMLESGVNIKFIEVALSNRIKKFKEEEHQRQLQLVQEQSKAIQEQTVTAAQTKEQQDMAAHQRAIELIREKGRTEVYLELVRGSVQQDTLKLDTQLQANLQQYLTGLEV